MKYNQDGTIIEKIYQDDINGGVLDLSSLKTRVKGIRCNALSGCEVKKIIFPQERFVLYSYMNTGAEYVFSMGDCGLREFNVPNNYNNIYVLEDFIRRVLGGIKENYFSDKLYINGEGVLKYSELFALSCVKRKLLDLCKSFLGLDWLDLIESSLKEKVEGKQNKLLPITQEKRTLMVIRTLRSVLENGALWQSSFSHRDYNIEIDDENHVSVVFDMNGDTYKIDLENNVVLNRLPIPLSDEVAQNLNFLYENIDIVNEIVKIAYSTKADEKKKQEEILQNRKIKEHFLDNPVVKQAARIRDSGLDYDSAVACSLKPKVESDFFFEYYDFFKKMGLIPFLNLERIDFSHYNLEGLDLSNSNIRLNLLEYSKTGFTLKNTDLENVPLLRQELNGIVADGANFKGTCIFITPSRDRIDGATFDESCCFFRENGSSIPFSDLRRIGFRIDKEKQMELKLKI